MALSRTPRRRAARRLLAAAAALALAACGADPDELVALQTSWGLNRNLNLARSETYQLSVFAIHADGRGEAVTADWTSSSPEIATVRECSSPWIAACTTIVAFDVAGVTTLTAAYGGLSRSLTVAVK